MNLTIVYILLSVAGGAIGQIVLKKGMESLGPLTLSLGQLWSIIWRLATNPYVIIGLAIYVVSTLFWLTALSRADLSFVYPFASLSYVGMLVAAWLIFKEDISLLRLAGTLMIGLGIFTISRS